MNASGSKIRSVPRTRSTQKLPSSPLRERTKPRIRATATARPTAAERKFCTASPPVCALKPSVDSPPYDCQLVLVTNETAVLRPMSHGIPDRPRSNGSACWPIRIANRQTMLTSEKPSTLYV